VAVTWLFKSKLIFALACLLVWTSTDCAALCASQCSDVSTTQAPQSEPPCHHHHQPGNQGKGVPGPCNHREVQTTASQPSEKVVVAAGLVAIDLPSASPVPQSPAPITLVLPHDLPPVPDPDIQFSVVLRI
jgi:hypothetical protein